MAAIGNITLSFIMLPADGSTLAAAFTEWHRRWTEEPARFQSEAESLATPNQTYGENASAYLLKILGEQDTPPVRMIGGMDLAAEPGA